jgi:hypothetical protein
MVRRTSNDYIYTILKHQFRRSSHVIFFTNNPFYYLKLSTRHILFTSIASNPIRLFTPRPQRINAPHGCERLSHSHNNTNPHTPCLSFIAAKDMASGSTPNALRQESKNPCTPHLRDGEIGFSRPTRVASSIHRNMGKAAAEWSRFTDPNSPTNLATKSRIEAPQAITVVDVLATGGLTLCSYSDSLASILL